MVKPAQKEYRTENLKNIKKIRKKGVDKWESFWYSNQALKRAGQKAGPMTEPHKALCKLNNDHENKEP